MILTIEGDGQYLSKVAQFAHELKTAGEPILKTFDAADKAMLEELAQVKPKKLKAVKEPLQTEDTDKSIQKAEPISPTTAEAPTAEQITDKVLALGQAGKRDAVKAVLAEFGVAKFGALAETEHLAFYNKICQL